MKAQINLRSVFDRKNYFYPDLPQGYQISQYKSPIVGEGEVIVELSGGESVTVGIERLHLEQDAGKSLHDRSPTMSYVDLNRSGVAVMEIVSKPDIRSSEQAKAYVMKLRSILRYLGTCDGDMEKGNLRADVNVSVRKPGQALGTRCEIKNMNSIAFIGQAIEYEARRQVGILEDGGTIEQETRLFDPNKGETRSMRSKEEAHDYRYFPDPDPDGPVRHVDRDLALAHHRRLVLADLVALRQVRIEIVLAVEHRAQIDLRVQAQTGADRLADAFLVDHRQHARHRRVDQRNMGVRLTAEFGRGAGEQL